MHACCTYTYACRKAEAYACSTAGPNMDTASNGQRSRLPPAFPMLPQLPGQLDARCRSGFDCCRLLTSIFLLAHLVAQHLVHRRPNALFSRRGLSLSESSQHGHAQHPVSDDAPGDTHKGEPHFHQVLNTHRFCLQRCSLLLT